MMTLGYITGVAVSVSTQCKRDCTIRSQCLFVCLWHI